MGVSLSGVPGGDEGRCHEQRDPAYVATKPAHEANKATWGCPPFDLRVDLISLASTASTRSSSTRISAAAPQSVPESRVYKVSLDRRLTTAIELTN